MEQPYRETARDTFVDLLGYSLIGIAMVDDKWNDSLDGIKDPEYRKYVIMEEFLPLFAEKLMAYGTKDLSSIEQITQRMKEKILRIENLSGGSPRILVKRVAGDHNGIQFPRLDGDVGYDLSCSEDFELPPHGNASAAFILPAGIHIKSPYGYFSQIVGRSSAARQGIGVQTAVIDNGYTGPLFACCWNMTDKPISIKKGDKIAQLIFFPMSIFGIAYVDELPETKRGAQGFGSTGG